MMKFVGALGLIIDIFGAFLLSVEAIKAPNLAFLLEKFGQAESVLSKTFLKSAKWMAIAVFGAIVAVGAFIYGSFLLAFGVAYLFGVDIITDRLDRVFLAIIKVDPGDVFWAAVFTILFYLLAGWLVLKILRNRIVALMRYIEANTESGTCGLLGFAFLFFGFLLQLVGTIFG